MRGVGVGGVLLAGLSAAVVLSLDCGGAAAGEQAALSPAAADTDDYYTRRAKKILKSERSKAAEPHPLAASHPGMDVVVCAAGCPDHKGAEIVFMRKQVIATEGREAMMVPTSGSWADPVDAAAPTSVACIAGCYGDTRAEPSGTAPRPVERMALPPRDTFSPIR